MKILILTTDQELALLRQRALEMPATRWSRPVTEKESMEAPDKQETWVVALICTSAARCHGEKSDTACSMNAIPRANSVYIVHLYGEWPEVEADRYVVAGQQQTLCSCDRRDDGYRAIA